MAAVSSHFPTGKTTLKHLHKLSICLFVFRLVWKMIERHTSLKIVSWALNNIFSFSSPLSGSSVECCRETHAMWWVMNNKTTWWCKSWRKPTLFHGILPCSKSIVVWVIKGDANKLPFCCHVLGHQLGSKNMAWIPCSVDLLWKTLGVILWWMRHWNVLLLLNQVWFHRKICRFRNYRR